MTIRFHVLACALVFSASFSFAQRPPAQPNAAEILHKMQKLQVVGSVLYIVAHPDDENTKLIAWLANGKKVRAGNLSLTRGDGGQNLIGPELGDALGIIRTQELMEARRIDGGKQFFTRAVDFGYSKSADESFEKWGKQEVLSDVVRVIRQFRPDIIITRFSHIPGGTHGHHTASAILAQEAFDLAGDPNAFPEQLKEGLEVWQPRSLYHNGSTWWRKDLADIVKTDPDWFAVDVGGYDPLLGLSYTEIAGRSRSMHKSQGFGAAETRGAQLEYLHFEKGERPKGDDIFEEIDMTWKRYPALTSISANVDALNTSFDVNSAEKSFAKLKVIRKKLLETDKTNATQWRAYTLAHIDDLILAIHGISIEANAPGPEVISGEKTTIDINFLLRRPGSVTATIANGKAQALTMNEPTSIPTELTAPTTIDGPFWLANAHGTLFNLDDPRTIGAPVLPQVFNVDCSLDFGEGVIITRSVPVMHRWVDRVKGELISACHVTPFASIYPQEAIIIAVQDTQMVAIGVEALSDQAKLNVHCDGPYSWTVKPMETALGRVQLGDRRGVNVLFTKQQKPEEAIVKMSVGNGTTNVTRTKRSIDYDHLMPQVYTTPAAFKIVPIDVRTTAKHVGYINGAGDDVAKAIEQLGATLDLIDPSTATLGSISKYDAIVVGIRAYNTEKAMAQFNPTLMKFVENGGTVVVQYNTRSSDMVLPDSLIGPYPFEISRERVTVEEAPPTFLDPKHPLLNTPNTITMADFDGWVQERGLYFVGERDPKYTPLISWNDPGEEPLDGALISCDYGKGRYVYTGISFFRELPAGVAGAYRLFANLISRRTEK